MKHFYSDYCTSPETKERFETVLQQVKDKSINFRAWFPDGFIKDKEHPVWKYINSCDEDSNKIVCKMCSSELSILNKKNQLHGTSIRRHLQMKHSLEWLEIYTEWYIANNQTIEEPKVVKTTNGKHINVKKLKHQKPKHIKFPHKTKGKKIKKKRKWSKYYEPWDFYQRCEKDPVRAICNICSSSQRTCNMRRHIAR